ncbi:thiamine ABC transporter substrate-binding protein [Halobacterium litoreum]|uniref:Thiamine ABC transporter substrate binding subunit n=1 Tax=Halobacterium litoreum TaxID=2039234 RepID=A0ABD5NFP7_9EURY|nr:thiamine ABC transporter substrate-binding protein [Halobacterium litoreum]UHH13249.1 thiamine ABC transporter substrate-binding protein [Halobacterium litoreum]
MKRREYLTSVGVGAVGLATAGCLQVENSGGGDTTTSETTSGDGTTTATTGGTTSQSSGPLRVATYDSFFGDEGTAGDWLKTAWEAEHDTEVRFTAPSNGVNEFIQRKKQGVDIDADLFVGLNTGELVRVDENLPNATLFDDLAGDVANAGDIKDSLRIDPQNRALPYDTGYISLVYDGTKVENPGTFEALASDAYRGDLLAQNAQTSDPGRAFLLWTIHEFGEDGYLDYWDTLVDNDVRVLDDWQPAYDAFLAGERPIVVSYSTDQVYYNGEDEIPRHQVGFLNDEGYANPEAFARFADTDKPDIAAQFAEFMLTDEAQRNIAVNNVQFPATTTATLPEEYAKYAYEPPEPVTFTYDELAGNVGEWTEAWAQQIASN